MNNPEYQTLDTLVPINNLENRRGRLASFAAGTYATLGALSTAKTLELAATGYPTPVIVTCGALSGVLLLNAGHANLVAELETNQESEHEG